MMVKWCAWCWVLRAGRERGNLAGKGKRGGAMGPGVEQKGARGELETLGAAG